MTMREKAWMRAEGPSWPPVSGRKTDGERGGTVRGHYLGVRILRRALGRRERSGGPRKTGSGPEVGGLPRLVPGGRHPSRRGRDGRDVLLRVRQLAERQAPVSDSVVYRGASADGVALTVTLE